MAGIIPYETGDIVEMKKKHPCGSSEWEILKAGADIKMKCLGCGHEIIIKRSLAQKNTKKIEKSLKLTSGYDKILSCDIFLILVPSCTFMCIRIEGTKRPEGGAT